MKSRVEVVGGVDEIPKTRLKVNDCAADTIATFALVLTGYRYSPAIGPNYESSPMRWSLILARYFRKFVSRPDSGIG